MVGRRLEDMRLLMIMIMKIMWCEGLVMHGYVGINAKAMMNA